MDIRTSELNKGRKPIFVFGSNTYGRHGAGAALHAKEHYGARSGAGYGLFGESFAIPTKNGDLETLLLSTIKGYVQQFLNFAKQHPGYVFWVTRIGCGLAGYRDEDIAPMFADCPENVILPRAWGGEGFEE